MSAPSPGIGEGSRVTLHFALLLDNGDQVDTTRNGAPATFQMGDGNLPGGFEAALVGMRAGETARMELPSEQAFGAHRRENLQLMARDRFESVALEPGLVVSFSGPGGELPGVVTRVFEQTVEVDFNHPLAGRRILFDVEILAVDDGDAGSGDSVAHSSDE